MNHNPDGREPGTLVWVGTTTHPEFLGAFRFCQDHAAQLAVRRDEDALLARPAGFVQRILFARLDRRPLAPRLQQELLQRYAGGSAWR